MLKKIMIVTLVVLLLAGCAATTTTKTGLGHSISIEKSKDVSEKDGAPVDGTAQADTMMAAVTVDANGKVLGIRIDTAQVKIKFNAEGKITSDKAVAGKTKVELGMDYGMLKASAIGKEWFEQSAAIEAWMVGKTSDQIKNMKTKDSESEGKVADEADLNGKVSIGIADFLVVAQEAIANAK
jgi:uncharacterized protein YuzE